MNPKQPGHCPNDGHGLQLIRDLTTDDDLPQWAAQCALCDRFYWVRIKQLTFEFQVVVRTASRNARRRKAQPEADAA